MWLYYRYIKNTNQYSNGCLVSYLFLIHHLASKSGITFCLQPATNWVGLVMHDIQFNNYLSFVGGKL